MKAAYRDRYGSPEEVVEIRDLPVPPVGDDRVLVRVHAAGVNPLDRHGVRGAPFVVRAFFGLREPKVKVLGVDLAGTVESVGAMVTDFAPGDRVYGEAGQAFAEYAAVKESALAPMPEGTDFIGAASLPVVALTAIQGLRDIGQLRPGQRVLVNGASGGVGSAAVQVAKAMGAEVTGVCGTTGIDLVRSLGADHVIDYTSDDYTALGDRYDLIFDIAGSHPHRRNLKTLTPKGRLVIVGSAELKYIGPLLRAAMLRPFVRQDIRNFTAKTSREDLLYLNHLVESGRLRPVIDRTFELSDAAAAIAFVEQGHPRGKVVLTLG